MISNSQKNASPHLFPFFTSQPAQDLLIAICGGSCSGKTSLADYLASLRMICQ
jgi:polynucleotide 5'-kinase involved in rRNA processing